MMYNHDKFIIWSTNVKVLILRDNYLFPVRLTSSCLLASKAELKDCSDLAEYHILCKLYTACGYTHKITLVTTGHSFNILCASVFVSILYN